MNSTQSNVVVVGSLNVDHTLRVKRLPAAGETLSALSMMTCHGGKGANQALAAARAGGSVAMIGCVGSDDAGTRYLEHLRNEGIDTRGILRASTATGCAMIAVDDAGENCIIVNAGANHEITSEHLDANSALFTGATVLLIQLECPLPVVKRAAELARAHGAMVVLNPSPWNEEWAANPFPVDVLIVNEHEANLLGECKPEWRTCIVTRGGDCTSIYVDGGLLADVTPPKVTPVDTVGAGDTFAGALAQALASGISMTEAVRFACAAGALATLKPGAQSAIPSRGEVMSLLAQ
jgi:ribokinase